METSVLMMIVLVILVVIVIMNLYYRYMLPAADDADPESSISSTMLYITFILSAVAAASTIVVLLNRKSEFKTNMGMFWAAIIGSVVVLISAIIGGISYHSWHINGDSATTYTDYHAYIAWPLLIGGLAGLVSVTSCFLMHRKISSIQCTSDDGLLGGIEKSAGYIGATTRRIPAGVRA